LFPLSELYPAMRENKIYRIALSFKRFAVPKKAGNVTDTAPTSCRNVVRKVMGLRLCGTQVIDVV